MVGVLNRNILLTHPSYPKIVAYLPKKVDPSSAGEWSGFESGIEHQWPSKVGDALGFDSDRKILSTALTEINLMKMTNQFFHIPSRF